MDEKVCKECMDIVTEFAKKTDIINQRLISLAKWTVLINGLVLSLIIAIAYYFQRGG